MVKLQTNHGTITLELDAAKAPKTVANFLAYVQSGHYPDLREKKGDRPPVENEAGNGLKNELGTLAMARTPNPHSATAQFFINIADNAFLNYRDPSPAGFGYAVFGKVTEGMEVVMRIARTPTGPGGPFPKDVPQQAVIIESVTQISDK